MSNPIGYNCDELDELRAENDRLRAELAEAVKSAKNSSEAAFAWKAEIDRLRARVAELERLAEIGRADTADLRRWRDKQEKFALTELGGMFFALMASLERVQAERDIYRKCIMDWAALQPDSKKIREMVEEARKALDY